MIRYGVLYLFCFALMALAVRRWFYALCGLLFLTVVSQHPSMPRQMFGIPGMNPWNVTLMVIAAFWFMERYAMPVKPPVSPVTIVLLAAYILMIVASGIAGAMDAGSIKLGVGHYYNARWVLVDGIFNPLKYLIIGVMFYEGVTNRRDLLIALVSAVGSGLCYAFLMFKSIRSRVFTMDFEDARRLTDKLVGLFANDMGELLAFAIWAALILGVYFQRRWIRYSWWLAALLAVPPYLALKSRAGFLAFCCAGLAIGLLRWRRILLLMPLAIVVVIMVSPSTVDRVLTGVDPEQEQLDWEEISAGRLTNIWPAVVDQIQESIVFGHGRFAILREECADVIREMDGVLPTHPHSSYLEVLLDCGLAGIAICLTSMALIFAVNLSLMRSQRDPLLMTLGTIGVIGVVTELSAGVAGSSFYLSQSTVPYLCVWGMALRVVANAKYAPAPVVPRLQRRGFYRPVLR